MDALQIIAAIVYVIACFFLIFVVLLRKSQGSSLGSAFGVGGESPFGVKTYPRYRQSGLSEEPPAESSSE